MSPKKTKKPVKRMKMKKSTAKRSMQTNILSLAEKVEKEFRELPSKLAKLYSQELMAQKNQETRLKNEFRKAEAAQKAAQAKQKNLLQAAKPNKKRLAAAKKSNDQANKTLKMLTVKLDQMTRQTNMLLTKQNKYRSLTTELARLEKELTAKAEASVKVKKQAVKKTRPAKAKTHKKPQEEPMTEETPFMLSSKPETTEM